MLLDLQNAIHKVARFTTNDDTSICPSTRQTDLMSANM